MKLPNLKFKPNLKFNLKSRGSIRLMISVIFFIVLAVGFYNLFIPRDYVGFMTYIVVFVFMPTGLLYWLLSEVLDRKPETVNMETNRQA